jgi:hypothetical protein
MKKLLLIGAIGIMASCSNSAVEVEKQKQDSIAVADSIAAIALADSLNAGEPVVVVDTAAVTETK